VHCTIVHCIIGHTRDMQEMIFGLLRLCKHVFLSGLCSCLEGQGDLGKKVVVVIQFIIEDNISIYITMGKKVGQNSCKGGPCDF
jgi:hypothetical protein